MTNQDKPKSDENKNLSDIKEKNETLKLKHEDPNNDIIEKITNEHKPKSEGKTTEKEDFEVICDVDNILKLANMMIEAEQSQQINLGRNIFEEI